jgi:hypothetical protein
VDSERTPDAQLTGEVQRAYITELKELRRSEYGCTPEGLNAHRFLSEAIRRRLAGRARTPTVLDCINELKQIVEGIGDIERRTALLAALALEGEFSGRTLGERRDKYLATLAKGERRDTRTLQRWEDWAIEITALFMAEERSVGEQIWADSGGVEIHPALATPRNSVSTTHLTVTSFYSREGVLSYADYTRWVKATSEESETNFKIENTYLTETSHGISEIKPIFGCRIESQQRVAGGSIITILKLHKKLKPEDGEYSFSYRHEIHGTRLTDPLIWWHPWLELAEPKYESRIVFHPDMRPVRAWWFVDASIAYAQIEPAPSEGRYIELLDDGCYLFRMFENVQPNLHYGIAWIWPESGDIL